MLAAKKQRQFPSLLTEARAMLVTVAVSLFVLWAFGMLTSHTWGGGIHVLLIAALASASLRVLKRLGPTPAAIRPKREI